MTFTGFVFVLLATHWLADFVAQNSWMALNKSKNILALTAHSLVYFLVLGVCTVFVAFLDYTGFAYWFGFCVVNGAAHFGIDYVTSRINSKLWALPDKHWFFVSVGFDQLLHVTLLIWTAQYLFRYE